MQTFVHSLSRSSTMCFVTFHLHVHSHPSAPPMCLTNHILDSYPNVSRAHTLESQAYTALTHIYTYAYMRTLTGDSKNAYNKTYDILSLTKAYYLPSGMAVCIEECPSSDNYEIFYCE